MKEFPELYEAWERLPLVIKVMFEIQIETYAEDMIKYCREGGLSIKEIKEVSNKINCRTDYPDNGC